MCTKWKDAINEQQRQLKQTKKNIASGWHALDAYLIALTSFHFVAKQLKSNKIVYG